MPQASTFLWNRRMLLQLNCRGYATAQFMQPEPARYAHAPTLEAKSFMQPEQPYYAHHPGRFCYVKDEDGDLLFSAPHAPVNRAPDAFAFSVGQGDVAWTVQCDWHRSGDVGAAAAGGRGRTVDPARAQPFAAARAGSACIRTSRSATCRG